MNSCRLATRQSPLALAQSHLVASRFRDALNLECELIKFVTVGDRQTEWNLEEKGGKGLFTTELEQALLRGEVDLAVHSTKDLPGEMPPGLAVAGYLPRADAHDMLVTRAEVAIPATIATNSPRRRLQLTRLFPGAKFDVLRGNVDTRLRKIAHGVADATVLAAAGLKRLGIGSWPGLTFRRLRPDEMTPAVGQGAIAVQCRAADVRRFAPALHVATALHVDLERALQRALGGGCHTAFGAHVTGDVLHFFHERTGHHEIVLSGADLDAPAATAARMLATLGLT